MSKCKLNLGNSIFKGFNDKEGIMICGYEWGLSQEDIKNGRKPINEPIDVQHLNTTFSNKINVEGDSCRYDERIIKWFELWEHPFGRHNGDFEKCIIQTNWCPTQANNMHDTDINEKLKNCKDNFLCHIEELQPKIIFFMGSAMIDVLNDPKIKTEFEKIMGKEIKPLQKLQKKFNGKQFYIGLQSFEKCDIISLPHPTGTIGLSDDYIALFKDEIKPILDKYRAYKKV